MLGSPGVLLSACPFWKRFKEHNSNSRCKNGVPVYRKNRKSIAYNVRKVQPF